MISKWIKDLAFSKKRSIQERRFILAAIIGCVAIFAVMLSAITTNQGTQFVVLLLISLMVMVGTIVYTLRSKKFTLGGSIIILLSNVFLLPVGYPIGGGVNSGAPLWFVVGMIFVFVLFKGVLFWVYLTVTTVSFAFAFYFSATHPNIVVPLQEGYAVDLDTFISLMLVSLLVGTLFRFQSLILERELDNSEEQMKEIEKLNETQSSFFSSMSHEIRTPISTIIGLNEMTMREKNLSEEVLENTMNIQNASKMLLSLINDILDMSKIQSGKMEIVPSEYETSRMLSDITNFHWNRANEKNLGFDIQVAENIPPMLYGDENRIKQVIINLLTNAIKYTEEGSVTLRIGGDKQGADRFLLRIEVEDTGIGIRKENIQHLFDPFQRVEGADTKNIEGTGLGLSISKQLVDLMGGTISVNSIYTKGSTFRVEIPQDVVDTVTMEYKKPTIPTMEQPAYQQSFEAPRARVLIVDDNEMNRIVCRKLLRSTKVQVDLAESGKDCLSKTKEKYYDAIFMDHEMPQMDGIETLHRIRQQPSGMCRETPVIALTANAGSDRQAFYLDKGFSAYLPKPIQSSRLEQLLLACLPKDLIEQNFVKQEDIIAPHIYEAVHKKPVVITTDSICDLPESVLSEYEILVMPYYIMTKQGRFRDNDEIDADNLMQYALSTDDASVHSSSAPVEEYEKFFADALSDARFVLHLSASKHISDAYYNALAAAESFGNVEVIDSGHISSSLGLVAIHAAELFRNGVRLEEVLPEIERYAKTVKLNFYVPQLTDSHTKYRSSLIQKVLTDSFNMDPIFTIIKGRLILRRYLLGYIRTTVDQFVRVILKNRRNIKHKRVFVTFSGCSMEMRDHVLSEIEKYTHFDRVIVSKSSAATYTNCGPNSFGIIYEKETVQEE